MAIPIHTHTILVLFSIETQLERLRVRGIALINWNLVDVKDFSFFLPSSQVVVESGIYSRMTKVNTIKFLSINKNNDWKRSLFDELTITY